MIKKRSATQELIAGAIIVIVLIFIALKDKNPGGIIFILILLAGAIYFVPTIVAMYRNHENIVAIGALNVLLGWLVVPWVIALVWALSRNQTAELIKQSREPVDLGQNTSNGTGTKVCPFCAEHIKAAAIKCKHCGSSLS